MALTQKEIALLTASANRYQRGCGDGLILVVEPVHKGGGKSFLGRFRKQINGTTKQIPVRIGVFGSKAGQFTLKQARERWFEIREWAKREGADPRNYGKTIPAETPKNLQNAVDGFLASKASLLREFTLKNYRLQLENQVYPSISPETLLVDLEWDNGGRQIVMNMKTCIEQRGSFDQANRVQKVLAQCFEYAIVQGWMNRNQNPATKQKGEKNKHEPGHHPTVSWDQVPNLLEAISLNRCSVHVQTVLAMKLMLMTFLRAGALVRLEWEWIDPANKILIIPGTTPGLKRTKKTQHLSHHVPITKEMEVVLEYAQKLNAGKKHIFAALRGTKYPHLTPDAPNNFLKNLGYKDVLRAHGWRSVPLTVGQDVMKVGHDIIQRQMGHLIGDKVRKAYDNSLMLDERRLFLERWCELLVVNGLKM